MTDEKKNTEKVLELLNESEKIVLSDEFNRAVLARLKGERRSRFSFRYKSAVLVALSCLIAVAVRQFSGAPEEVYTAGIAEPDLQVVRNLEFLDKMEVLEHLDIYLDTASSALFLQLLEKE